MIFALPSPLFMLLLAVGLALVGFTRFGRAPTRTALL